MKPMRSILQGSALIALLAAGCVAQASPSPTQPSPLETQVLPASTSSSVRASTITSAPSDQPSNILFDDFDYSSQDEMTAHGWIIRSKAGWPGIPGASFRPANVSFLADARLPGNRILRMTSSTDGTSANTFQTQICHQRKYLEGTYAARVYFTNTPAQGPDGDQVVETFYAITPYEKPLDPAYSEMDFEYLPNGAWGLPPMSFAFTTWETVRIEPWLADNTSNFQTHSMEGWHTLVVQVADGKVRYFVDGKQVAEHGGNYYPDAPMSINFNLWFVNGGLINGTQRRSYEESIDWVFHEAGVVLTPEQVDERIRALREAGLGFVDTVPAGSPPLDSPCDL
jgi:hypothetical protein